MTHNLSFDGVLDRLDSRRMTEAGPLDLLDLSEDHGKDGPVQRPGKGLPGALANGGRPAVRVNSVKISPTGRTWAVAATGGVLLYSLDDDLIFDPTDLEEDVTPQVNSL